MKRVLTWFVLTEKRLFKKISYIVVLLMVPVLVWGLMRGARQEAGMVTIGLYADAGEGSFSEAMVRKFMEEKSILKYEIFETEEAGRRALEESRVDALWIFPKDLEEELRALAKKGRIRPLVRVIEREDDVALIFTREVLCSRIFPKFVYFAYVDYVKSHLGEEAVSEEELQEIYDGILWKGNLFSPEVMDQKKADADSYVLSPVRGLLSIWLVLAGFAALLYYIMDVRKGVYDMIPQRKRLAYAFGMQGVVLLNCGIVFLGACRILGVLGNPVREVVALLLFLIAISVFCTFLGMVLRREDAIGVLIPFAVLFMVVLCPVFLDLRQIGAIRGIFPPYFYLKSISSGEYLVNLAGYAVSGLLLCMLMNLRTQKNS